MQEVLKKLQDSNTKQSTQILKLNESVATIYKKVESTDSTISKLYKEQVRANNAAAAAAKRAAADAKRKSADNPLKRMFEKQEKKQKDGNDLLGKILAALAGLGTLAAGVKGIFNGAKDQLLKSIGSIFGKDGFLRTTLRNIFGEKGFLRTNLGRIFGKDGFLRTNLGRIFGKDGFLRTNLGRIFGKEGFLRKTIGKAFSKLGNLIPNGLKNLGKTLTPVLKLLGNFTKGAGGVLAKGMKGAGGILAKGTGAVAKGAGGLLAKGAGGLASLALKRGPFAALFAAGDELLGEDPKLGRAAARGGGAAAGAGIGASVGSIVPVVGTIIGGALGAALGDFLGGFLYDKFPDIFKPLDEFGTSIGEKFNQIKKQFTNFGESVGTKFNEIKSNFDKIGKFLLSIPKQFSDFTKNIQKNVTDIAIKSVTKIFDSIKEAFSPLIDTIGGLIKRLNPFNFGRSEGGKLPGRKSGGWISGPQSGYPVSLDGGASASFIGHGTEYVAQRSSGGFVIPVDTPSTKTNPGLTQQRITEATGSGFNLSGMNGYSAGGVIKYHPNTGEGHNPNNAKDYKDRPVILSKEASTSFSKMMSDGGVNPSDVTSSQRSTDYNQFVGGVSNSNHLSGNAIDIHGSSKTWLRQGNDKKYGWKWLDYSGHDGHFDYVKGSGDTTPKKEGKEDKIEGNKKEGGLFGGPAGLMKSGLGWLGNLLGLGKFGDAFKKGYLEGTKDEPNGLAMQLYNMFMSDNSTSQNNNSDSISSNSSLGSGGGNLTTMTDQQWSDLAYAVSGEAQPNTNDDFGVAANILTRVADPNYPNTIMGVFTQPKQYAAYTDGGARRDEELAQRLKTNQSKIADALKQLNGRQSFKGTSQYKNMGPGDIKFSDRGNFYHYASQHSKSDPAPSSPPQHWKKFIEEEKSTKSEGNKVEQIIKGLPGASWLQSNTATTAATGHLGDAIRSELQNKPVGSELVIANSSETIIPQGKIKGRQTSNEWIDQSMNQSGQPSVIIVNSPSSSGGSVAASAEPGIQTPAIPSMSSGPTSPIASLLMTQTYLMADRIG